jgi:hypothetical protein
MLDDVRNDVRDIADEVLDIAKELSFDEEDDYLYEAYGQEFHKERFLGMTSGQRFVVALLLFAAVVVIGTLLLLLTESIWPF